MASKSKKALMGGDSLSRRIVFVAPITGSAADVVVTGDFTGWSHEGIRLKRRSDGAWSATLDLRPGEYQYRLIVDGEWRNNSGAERHAANPFGSENDVLVVG